MDIIITSPPYASIVPILDNALTIAKAFVAMKLPFSFLSTERDRWLKEHPPTAMIALSRKECTQFYAINVDEVWVIWAKDERIILNNFLL